MFKKDKLNYDVSFDYSDELAIRKKKLSLLREHVNIPFPNNFRRDHTSEELYVKFGEKDNEDLKLLNVEVSVAGRIISRRIIGKASFVTLQDVNGRIQLYISCNNLSKDFYKKHFKKWDLGDIIGAKGKVFKTNTGELSIYCTELNLLTKALRSIPNKFQGLKNQETRYRQRYLDLISNDKSRKTFKIRSRILIDIRKFLIDRNFIEVETPMIQVVPGGASARPFITHHNVLNIDMYLRISPELYLKRLVIGGFERIFEINRNFRNEGVSTIHNPEFTMMELYMAYADYKDLMELIESLFRTLTNDIFGNTKINYKNSVFDFSKPFEKMTMLESLKKYLPQISKIDFNNFNAIKSVALTLDIKVNNHWGLGRIITEIFDKSVKSYLIQPTFITEYPVEVSPLARRNDYNLEITDRFEFFIGGYEIANGFSELNDPEDQAKRFKEQILHKEKEDKKYIFFDNDYILALEHGLPPTAGLGIGIDRMVMILTNNHNIRDVIFFPMMRTVK